MKKIHFKLSKSQYVALTGNLQKIVIDAAQLGELKAAAMEEILWALQVKLGRRFPTLKEDMNQVTLSAAEAWAMMEGFKSMHEIGPYEEQQINYLTGVIHQKIV